MRKHAMRLPRASGRRFLLLSVAVALATVTVVSGGGGAQQAKGPAGAPRVRTAFDRDCEAFVIAAIDRARESVDVAIYSFMRRRLAEALLRCRSRKVEVRMKLDAEQAKFDYTRRLLARLRAAGVEIATVRMPAGAHMHHKFAVIDHRLVLTGSFNWTRQASRDNWENVVSIHSREVAGRFTREWERVRSGAE